MIWQVGQRKITFSKKELIMGILNVTPDSFSDSGLFLNSTNAVQQAHQMIADGADIIDIGGESTRPGAQTVSQEEELRRTIPVVQTLHAEISNKTSNTRPVLISIDTSKGEVARQAVAAGADIINDVSGFTEPEMIDVAKTTDTGLICMHMQGTPQNMQDAPKYDKVLDEITHFFQQQLHTLTQAGIHPERICLDPGIGFGKRLEDNLAILNHLEKLRIANRPILMGLSRKSFIAKLLNEESIEHRNAPTVALTALMSKRGANIHRVHDVKANHQALQMINAIQNVSKKS